MTSQLSKCLVFTKILLIRIETFGDVSDLKRQQINGTQGKENFLFNTNKRLLVAYTRAAVVISLQ